MAEIDSAFLEAFGLTQDDVDRANSNSGDNTDVSPDTQTQDSQSTTVDNNSTEGQVSDTNTTDAQQTDTQNAQDTQQLAAGEPTHNRANAAFAQMRTENTALKKLVSDIAGVLGIDANTPQAQMQAAVQDAILKAQAKQQNIDPAVLQRITQLEAYKADNERQSLTNKALMGFQAVKNQFKLSDEDVDKFAEQLMDAGVNPFTREVDLISEYKLRNFEALMAAAEERGKAQESARLQNVAAHSTQPGRVTGAGTDSEPDKISSVSELTNWFDKNTK